MSAIARLRQMRPHQILLMVLLTAVVIGQAVAMAMITQGQVDKAQAFYAQKAQDGQQQAGARQAARDESMSVAALQADAVR